jgi:flavin-dependent dehydrogenase
MNHRDQYDVAVVGAGTAGAAVAGFLAEHGMRVVCVDRRPLDRAGAHWVNGVPASAFERAGLPPPAGPEHRGGEGDFHLVAGHGPHRLVIDSHGVLEVDMRLLVARLQDRARRLGVNFVAEVGIRGVKDGELITDRGPLAATWFIDASGLTGARLLDQPSVPAQHICVAAQEVRRVIDKDAARAFFARHDTAEGDVLCFAGIAGGYSILNLRLSGDHVSILTGSIPAAGYPAYPSGKAILSTFVASQPWIGEPLFGGARAIPVRRPRDVLARGPIALLGDAGCQVFPAHGSGIGTGLIAARVLADTLAAIKATRSGSTDLHAYAVAWQRKHGGLLAAYDLFRRFSQTLCAADIECMMKRGLMDPELGRAGLEQTLPGLPARVLPGKLVALARCPGLSARLARVGARMLAVRALYARYPRDPAHLPRWSRAVARLFRDPPDIPGHT